MTITSKKPVFATLALLLLLIGSSSHFAAKAGAAQPDAKNGKLGTAASMQVSGKSAAASCHLWCYDDYWGFYCCG